MEEEILFADAQGNRLGGTLSVPADSKKVVIMSHGFTSNRKSKFYIDLQQDLRNADIGSFRYEYYGHGPLYGHAGPEYGVSKDVTLSKAVASLTAAIATVKQRGFDEIGLVGSSFGGLVSLICAAKDPTIKVLALRSSVTEPVSFWRERLGDERIVDWKRTGILHYNFGHEIYDLEYGYWEDLQQYDTLKLAENIECPIMMVAGDADPYVPLTQCKSLAKVLQITPNIIKDGDHAFSSPLHYPYVKGMIVNFLALHC